MAFLITESFDHLTGPQITLKGWGNSVNSTVGGRYGGLAAKMTSSVTALRTKALGSAHATVIAGMAFQSLLGIPVNQDFLILQAGATGTARLSFNASGQLQVRNSSGTVIATGTTVILANVWYFVELKIFVNGAAGTCEVHLNGATEIASTAGNFGSTNIDTFSFSSPSSSATGGLVDDIYVIDTTGSANNTFLGDVQVEWRAPDGDGAHTALVPTGGGSHYTQVNDATPDDDTTYVSSATPGDIDTYTIADVDGASTVFAVQKVMYARKDDAGTRQIAAVTRQAGTDHVGATKTVASTYAFYTEIDETDGAGSPWTAATLNGDEFGVKVIA
jgi:hypothetical protein